MESTGEWYYALSGEQFGPIDLEEIKNLIAQEKIILNTKVWNGEGDWKLAKETILLQFFAPTKVTAPPPLIGNDIDNKFAWAIVAVPVIGSIIEILANKELVWLYLIANIVLCVLDERKLKKAGHKSPTNWMALIVPLYLWRRASLLNHKKFYFIAWCVTFVVSIFITSSGNEAVLADSACPVVTEIIQKQLYGAATCKKVDDLNKVSDGFYRAKAILDNGNELSITIEERKNGQIYVQIPNQ